VKPQAWFNSPWLRVHHEIPQGDKGLLSRYTVTAEQVKAANMAQLEHVTVTMNVNHTRRGDISVELRSPAGIVSHLSVARQNDEHPGGYEDWTFMSVAHWYVSHLPSCGMSAD
jgi:kexin